MANDILRKGFANQDHQEHVERQGERMRDATELDNLKADIRESPNKAKIEMPWRIGRPLRSGGMNPVTGEPVTPLAALNLHKVMSPREVASLGRELDRTVILDQVSEGVLDQAEQQGVVLQSEDTPYDVDVQVHKDEAEVAKQLTHPPVPCTLCTHLMVLVTTATGSKWECHNLDCVLGRAYANSLLTQEAKDAPNAS